MADEERDGTDDSFNKDTIMGLFSVGPDSFVDNAMSTVQRAAGEATSGTASAVFSSVDDVAGGIPNRAAAAVFSSVDDVTGGGEVVASYVRGLFTSTDDIQDDSSLAASPPLSPLSEDDISPFGGDRRGNEVSGRSTNDSSGRSKSSFDGSHAKSASRDRSWTPDSDILRDDRTSVEGWGEPIITATPPSNEPPQASAPAASSVFAGSSLMARRKAAAAAAAAATNTDAASVAASLESPGDRAAPSPLTTTTPEGSSQGQPSVKLTPPPKPSLAQLAKPQNDDTDGWTEQLAEQGVIRDITHNLHGEPRASFDSGDEWPESGGEDDNDDDNDADSWRANIRAPPIIAPVAQAKAAPTLSLAARRGFQLGKPPVKAPAAAAAAATPPPPVASMAAGPAAGSSLMARRAAAVAAAAKAPAQSQVSSPPKLSVGVGSTSISSNASGGGGGSSLAARRGFSLGGPPATARGGNAHVPAAEAPSSAGLHLSGDNNSLGSVAGGSSLAARRRFQLQKAPVSAPAAVAPPSGSSLAARRGFKLGQTTSGDALTLNSSGLSSSAATTTDSASNSTSLTPGSTPPRGGGAPPPPLTIGGEGGVGGGGPSNRFAPRGLSLSIDTKAAAAANHGNAWAGVRLKNPQAARLRKTKEISSPDSPTVAKLLGAAQLGARGILLEVNSDCFRL